MTFRVMACVGRMKDGWFSTHQVPLFALHGEIHGLANVEAAHKFAQGMLADLAGVDPSHVSLFVEVE